MKPLTKIAHWTPRILCILAILLLSMFALDAFHPGFSFGKQLLAFVIHLIPSFILIGALIFAWKWEFPGGMLLIAIGLGLGIFIFRANYLRMGDLWKSLTVVMALAFPFLVSGILFLTSDYLKKKEKPEEEDSPDAK